MVTTYISSTYSTADRVIRQAMENAQLLAEGQDPSSEALVKAIHRLNDILNATQSQRLQLWKLLDQSITLVAGTATYTLGSSGTVDIDKPQVVEFGYYLDADGNRMELTPLAWEEYRRVSNATTQGSVVNYFVDKQLSILSVSFWPTPDTNAALGTAHLVIKRTVTQVSELDTVIDVPREWYLALTWILADELAANQPEAVKVTCQGKAAYWKKVAEDGDVEDTPMYLTMDMGGYDGTRDYI